jgi:hypothetical protein
MATPSIPELVTTRPKFPDGGQNLVDVAEILRSLREYLAQINFTMRVARP